MNVDPRVRYKPPATSTSAAIIQDSTIASSQIDNNATTVFSDTVTNWSDEEDLSTTDEGEVGVEVDTSSVFSDIDENEVNEELQTAQNELLLWQPR